MIVMSRSRFPLLADDISAFARTLSRELATSNAPPGHLSLLNMLARSSGFRNFQHLRAAHAAGERLAASAPPPEAIDHDLVERASRQFGPEGRLRQWPSRRGIQILCLWVLWSRLPAGVEMIEKQVNANLNASHDFGDPAILRRSLFGMGLVSRQRDGSGYRRQEHRPPPEARALIRLLEDRRTRTA
jgi:hypothetical protein